jgi:hypothetical protein
MNYKTGHLITHLTVQGLHHKISKRRTNILQTKAATVTYMVQDIGDITVLAASTGLNHSLMQEKAIHTMHNSI